MIRHLVAGALLFAASAPAAADSCSLMTSRDDLPNCVKDLQSRVWALEVQLNTERARVNMYGTIACSLATEMNHTSPSPYMASTEENACAEVKERLAARKPRPAPPPKQPAK